jgi:transcriptional regulator with XRE-family HTH domain
MGSRVRHLQRDLGLTQARMAEDLDISPSYVALIERNQRPLTADLLLRLAKTYGIDVAEFAVDDSKLACNIQLPKRSGQIGNAVVLFTSCITA